MKILTIGFLVIVFASLGNAAERPEIALKLDGFSEKRIGKKLESPIEIQKSTTLEEATRRISALLPGKTVTILTDRKKQDLDTRLDLDEGSYTVRTVLSVICEQLNADAEYFCVEGDFRFHEGIFFITNWD